MPPDGLRSEGTLSLSEVPYAGAKPFGLPFRRLEKVTRRKGETASGSTRNNGYAHNSQNQKIAACSSSYTCVYGLHSSLRQPQPKESVPCLIENAIVPDVNAPSKTASMRTLCTASTTAARPAPTTTRGARNVQARAASARIPSKRTHKKVEPNQAPLPVSGCHLPAARYGAPYLVAIDRQP